MWSRADLKHRAKASLRGTYWRAFFVTLICTLVAGAGLSGAGSGITLSFDLGGRQFGAEWMNSGAAEALRQGLAMVLPFFITTAALGGMMGLALSLLVRMPLETGSSRYFLESTQRRHSLENLLYPFTCSGYFGIVAAMALRAVYNFLWYLLLWVPGVIKSYAYSMVPYILAENPRIGANRAITLSREMTRGHRFDMFVLDLSFWGWYFLGALLFGVGVFFIHPYKEATKAELYVTLRAIALDRGFVSLEELTPPDRTY